MSWMKAVSCSEKVSLGLKSIDARPPDTVEPLMSFATSDPPVPIESMKPPTLAIEAGGANRHAVGHGHVDHCGAGIGHVAAVDRLEGAAHAPFERVELRLVRHVLEHAAQRACAIQRALRTAQHLDARDVEGVEIAGENGAVREAAAGTESRLIDVHADGRRDTAGVDAA